jgi:hypothetical protein
MTPVVERPPKQKLTWLWVLLGCAGCGLVLFILVPAVLFPIFLASRHGAWAVNCEGNLEQISQALEMYRDDWDGFYPEASSWTDAVDPYLTAGHVLKCPAAKSVNSYAFNSKLSHIEYAEIANPRTKPEVYDSDTGVRNANDPCTSLPSPGRHEEDGVGGNYVAFCDSHVEFVPDTRKLKP